MKPNMFHRVQNLPVGLGMGKIEYEVTACHILNEHIDKGQPFDQPIQTKYSHPKMVESGWLDDHGNQQYTLTKKTLGLLWAKYSK